MSWQKTSDPSAVKPWFLRDAPGTAIVPELLPSEDLVLDKLSMSAFEGTPLAFALRDCGITGVAICGIAVERWIRSRDYWRVARSCELQSERSTL
jgi:nicotinamidase-related amidase